MWVVYIRDMQTGEYKRHSAWKYKEQGMLKLREVREDGFIAKLSWVIPVWHGEDY